MGGKTELDRVVAYVPADRKKELEKWAEAEDRSVSWLLAKLIDKALQERQQRDGLEHLPEHSAGSAQVGRATAGS